MMAAMYEQQQQQQSVPVHGKMAGTFLRQNTNSLHLPNRAVLGNPLAHLHTIRVEDRSVADILLWVSIELLSELFLRIYCHSRRALIDQ